MPPVNGRLIAIAAGGAVIAWVVTQALDALVLDRDELAARRSRDKRRRRF